MMARESQVSAQEAYNYSGIYISYSLSSAADALKVEPYLITASENNEYVRVVHMSAYNTTHSGVGLFNNHTSSYILFNERESPELALFTIYLQLPMYDFPKMLKGLYLCLDYNRNPIARRILFVKHSDSTDMDDFLALKGEIIPKEQIPDDLLPYYIIRANRRFHQDLYRPVPFIGYPRPGTEKRCWNSENKAALLPRRTKRGFFYLISYLYSCQLFIWICSISI